MSWVNRVSPATCRFFRLPLWLVLRALIWVLPASNVYSLVMPVTALKSLNDVSSTSSQVKLVQSSKP